MEQVKISYSAPLRRVKVGITPAHCKGSSKILEKIIERGKAKAEAELAAGWVDSVLVFEDEFREYWKRLSEDEQLDTNEWFYFNLVQGGFRLPSLQLKADEKGEWIKLSIDMNEREVKLLNWPNFWLNVQLLLKENKVAFLIHEGMLRSFYLELKNGKKNYVQKIRLHSEVAGQASLDTSVSLNSERQEAYLYLGDPKIFNEKDALSLLIHRAENAFKKIKQRFPEVVFLKSDLRTHLQMILKGPERVGLLLPRTLLFAHALDDGVRSLSLEPDFVLANQKVDKTKAAKAPAARKKPSSPVAAKKLVDQEELTGENIICSGKDWLFKFEVGKDALEATIAQVNQKRVLSTSSKALTREILVKEIESAGIKFGYQSFIEPILNKVAMEGDPTGLQVAEGEAASAGEQAHLYPLYMDTKLQNESETIDIRAMQNKNITTKDSPIAEPRYLDGVPGKNIFAEAFDAPVPKESYEFELGEGVYQAEDGIIYAGRDGMPIIDGNKVDVSPVYIHEGDVDLKSGNVMFSGSAQINGNIETGATVIVKENLIVNGTIGRATVRVGGDLIVEGGIVTGDVGWVHVGGNMTADFIENARISVAGNLMIKRSLMNSKVFVGDTLRMEGGEGNRLGGGIICVRNEMIVGQLGFGDGKSTVCRVGADWEKEQTIIIQESRMKKIQLTVDKESRNLEELKSRKVKTPQIEEKIQLMGRRLQKMKALIRKLDGRISQTKKILSWNQNAMIRVDGILVNNVEITMDGKAIPIKDSLEGVLITAQRINDSKIHSSDLYEDFQKRQAI